jgi:acyl-homoserine-lactone acylase
MAGLQNTNSWPYRAAGVNSPEEKRFRNTWTCFGENYRGLHAPLPLDGNRIGLSTGSGGGVRQRQPGFAELIPQLLKAL